jgi:FGGY-family pentulose kinase
MGECVAAVDVGTGSARAGIFDRSGRLLGRAESSIDTRHPAPGHAEQDSEQIWRAAVAAVRKARAAAGVAAEEVRGIAFDATCSLVVRDREDAPLAVSSDGENRWDTLLWLDHRAETEAAECTATGHPVVARDGGVISPELQIPKLMWLKRHLPHGWSRAGRILDLTDFLAWRASGTPERSVCALACKWSYQTHLDRPWPSDYHAALGLEDLLRRARLPDQAVAVGTDLGPLTPQAAQDLGLVPGCRVGAGLIDAHAGALGSLAGRPGSLDALALIAGTSNCVMSLAPETPTRRGIWGPHKDAILPGHWSSEGGQSASGALLDHVCRIWGGGAEPSPDLHARICARIEELIAHDGWNLAAELHVLPDFAGNRTPFADPGTRGAVSGLGLDTSFDGLCRLYWRSAVGIALGLRQIVGLLADAPRSRPDLYLSGGHARSSILRRLYATATGCRVVILPGTDAVLLGTAMAAAAGVGLYSSLAAAAQAMRQPEEAHLPDPEGRAAMDRDYAVFLTMQRHRRELEGLMAV